MDVSADHKNDDVPPRTARTSDTPVRTMSETPQPSRAGLSRLIGVVTIVYWLALFTAMHVHLSPGEVSIPGADKVVHFVGYGILGLLLTFWVGLRRKLTPRILAVILLVLAMYGIADELLQILVGRTCDAADWVADMCGGSVGILLMTWITRLKPKRDVGRSTDEPPKEV